MEVVSGYMPGFSSLTFRVLFLRERDVPLVRDVHAKMAVEAKVPLCLNTDAHGFSDFDQLLYGLLTARRAWATKADVLNTRPTAEFKKWLARKENAGW